jgi:hypothetical protein
MEGNYGRKDKFFDKEQHMDPYCQSFKQTIKLLTASGCFKLRGMLTVKLYATRRNS